MLFFFLNPDRVYGELKNTWIQDTSILIMDQNSIYTPKVSFINMLNTFNIIASILQQEKILLFRIWYIKNISHFPKEDEAGYVFRQ